MAANGDQDTPANGDQLTGSDTFHTSDLGPAGHTTWLDTTITGGTGRFEGATGELDTICQVGPGAVEFDENRLPKTMVSPSECMTTGRVS